MYKDGHKVRGAPRLPLNLLDALREFDKNKPLKAALGDEFSQAYVKMKTRSGILSFPIFPIGNGSTRSTFSQHQR